MATTEAAFKAVTKSPKQATLLAERLSEVSEGPSAFEAVEISTKGATVNVTGRVSYETAAVGPGHVSRVIETAARRMEDVTVSKIERVLADG